MKRTTHQSATRTEPPDRARRDFLSLMIALATGRGAGLALAQQPPVTSPDSPYSRAFNFASLDGWITPNSEFFVRSHFGIPKLVGPQWTIKVTGPVERERAFTIDELLKMTA